MKYFLPVALTYNSTNVSENETETGGTYTVYSETAGHNLGQQVKYGTEIFTALAADYPLARYIWEDLVSANKYAYDLWNKVALYPTAGVLNIAITSGVTVVYVRSNNSYYVAKTTGTVNFMGEPISSPRNFDIVTASPPPYRHTYNYPVSREDTLYWGYDGVANRYRALDSTIGTQTIKYGSTTFTASFLVNAVSAVSLFQVLGESVSVNVYDVIDPMSPILLYSTAVSLVDTSELDTYEKVCTMSPSYTPTALIEFPSRYALRIDITITKAAGGAGCGAIKIGRLENLGKALDGVDVNLKSFNQVDQLPNGEFVWNKDNSELNKTTVLRYNLKIDTPSFDSIVRRLKTITDKEVVLLGDDGDEYTVLVNYGAIRGASGTLYSNSTKSNATLEIENFT